MPASSIRVLSLLLLVASQTANAGFFDALKEAQDAVETAQKVIKQIPSAGEKEKQEEKQKESKPTPKKKTVSTSTKSGNSAVKQSQTSPSQAVSEGAMNPDFVHITGKVADLPYEDCPKVDVMGIRLGQNISTLINKYPITFDFRTNGGFYTHRKGSYASMWFEDRERIRNKLKYPDGTNTITVFSTKFDAMRHQAMNRGHGYQFSDEDYNQVKDATKKAGRHLVLGRFYLKPPKKKSGFESLVNDFAEVTLDVNGDIAAIYVSRTLSVEINETEVRKKLAEKYGEAQQGIEGANGKTKYHLAWDAKKGTNHPKFGTTSKITYRLSCYTVLEASNIKSAVMLDEVDKKIKSLRKETGVSVDI